MNYDNIIYVQDMLTLAFLVISVIAMVTLIYYLRKYR